MKKIKYTESAQLCSDGDGTSIYPHTCIVVPGSLCLDAAGVVVHVAFSDGRFALFSLVFELDKFLAEINRMGFKIFDIKSIRPHLLPDKLIILNHNYFGEM